MSRLNRLKFPIVFAAGLLIFLYACGTGTNSNMGTMEVRLHDAPIDSADEVNVHIERVEANRGQDPDGWMTISEPNQTYDLLKLSNGAYTVLGEADLEAGTYQQIRLILSQDNHSVVIDSVSHDMIVPSGTQTGVKLVVNAEIKEDITYVLLLDFDASRSVVEAGQNNPSVAYLLQPVISATNKAITGNISGTASPADAEPVAYAISGVDTVSTTVADTSSGEFKLIGLEAGTYTVSIKPRNDSYQTTNITDVEVVVDETNDLGTITLN